MRRNRGRRPDNALQKRPGEVRIIGGEWRGRRIRFPGQAGLRPSPDRVRETLFNWLAPAVAGARCLDLFAGSGALGLEALSRGAARVTFVERDRASAEALRSAVALLAVERALVIEGDALAWLAGPPERQDIVFLDPPFDSGLLVPVMNRLEAAGWLAPGAFIYVESPARTGEPAWPPGWAAHRQGRAGAVGYHLARREGDGGPT